MRRREADKATITRQKGEALYRAGSVGFSADFMDYVRTIPVTPERGSASGRALLDGKAVHIPDVLADPDYTFTEAQQIDHYRSVLAVPMLRDGTPIGVLVLTRPEARPFSDKQIELVSTFADQAAIAIENVRLFEEVQARTRELSQSLDDLRKAQDRLVQEPEKLASLGQLTSEGKTLRGDRMTATLPHIQVREFQPCNAGEVGSKIRHSAECEGSAMTELVQQDRAAKRDQVRKVADDVVTPNSLATHLGMTRQNVARLTAEAVIEQRSDGCYDQTASRLKYIKHLREGNRRSPRVEADAAHAKVKTEMLQLRLMEKKRELVRQDDVNALIDEMMGVVLTAMSSMPARCAPRGDLATRRNIERVVFEVRTEMAKVCLEMADKCGEPED